MGNRLELMLAELVEYRPHPLVMSDTEILDWMNEYCEQALYTRPTAEYRGGFVLYCDGEKSTGATLREAVQLAAAKYAEVNQ